MFKPSTCPENRDQYTRTLAMETRPSVSVRSLGLTCGICYASLNSP